MVGIVYDIVLACFSHMIRSSIYDWVNLPHSYPRDETRGVILTSFFDAATITKFSDA